MADVVVGPDYIASDGTTRVFSVSQDTPSISSVTNIPTSPANVGQFPPVRVYDR